MERNETKISFRFVLQSSVSQRRAGTINGLWNRRQKTNVTNYQFYREGKIRRKTNKKTVKHTVLTPTIQQYSEILITERVRRRHKQQAQAKAQR